jgi:hypothetical protein
MRHYSWTDMLYSEGVETHLVLATDAPNGVVLNHPSKKLLVRNDGPNEVFLAFGDPATVEGFKLIPSDGLVEIPVQCETVSVICNALQTASVRVTSCY